jgi:hypothetical protein
MFAELRIAPEVLGQTALSTRAKAMETILVTGLPARDLADLHMQSVPGIDDGLRVALTRLAERGVGRPDYYLMPHARYTVPFVKGEFGALHSAS